MEFIIGERLSENLDKLENKIQLKVCEKIGENIAIIHNNEIIHGDLTTSNMILHERKVYFIDFGLAFHSSKKEDKAVDLHLLRQALESKHFEKWEEYFKIILHAYEKKSNNPAEIIKQLEKVEARGRYKGKH
jgi:Kae1-associated kinase Bud32